MTQIESIAAIGVLATATFITRSLPFIIFRENKTPPKAMEYLSKTLPYAVMGLLVIYCLRNISFMSSPFGMPEIIALAVTVILHILKGNTILSIGAGTAAYMFLIQVIFA